MLIILKTSSKQGHLKYFNTRYLEYDYTLYNIIRYVRDDGYSKTLQYYAKRL